MNKLIFTGTFVIVSAILFNQAAYGEPNASSKYARTEPFTLDYSKGRTWQSSYKGDPNSSRLQQKSLESVCHASRSFDYETGSLGPELSSYYFKNPNYDGTQVIVHISIPLQKMFVLDRRTYAVKGDGLLYAWKTSTGYHDKHYGYDRGNLVFGQKGVVQIDHKNREVALKKLRSIAVSSGAKFHQEGAKFFVTYEKFPERRVDYKESLTKMSRKRAQESGVEVISEDANNPNLLVVKKYSLIYSDYFHSEPGFFRVQNGFSSKHISGESDASLETEVPFMP